MHALDDTIAAIATAPGAAGIAVVRLSGPRAIAIADAVFEGRAALAEAAGHTLHHGWAVWPGRSESAKARPAAPARRLDEVVAAVFRAPHSYTREEAVEFSCHGGGQPAARVLAALLRAGARLARPGEFTLRAFMNGRIDLAQAEAVADLIHAETRAAHDLALAQLAGELSRRLDAITDRLTDALAEVEARVDFAEDVGGVEVPAHVREAIAAVSAELAALLAGASYARAVREGVRVPIAGRPNVGKSSLFNALLGEERAIVTAQPGTTRDLLRERLDVGGVAVTLLDAAGLRESGDEAEAQGVARARAALEDCRAALWVVDRSAPLADEDRWIAARLAGKRVLVALNKCDLAPVTGAAEVRALLDGGGHAVVEVSATRGSGIGALRETLAGMLGVHEGGLGLAVSNARHIEALHRGREALVRARGAAEAGSPGEIVALELRESLHAIGEVTGRTVGEDLLDRIFSRFCIGK